MQVEKFIFIIIAIYTVACSHDQKAKSSIFHDPEPPVHIGAYGLSCYSFEYPNEVGPPSYSTDDIGKKSVPRLTDSQKRLIQRIKIETKLSTLRFFIEDTSMKNENKIVVFNADHGACPNSGQRYDVYNGMPNEFYQPGENPFIIKSFINDSNATPMPWVHPGDEP